MRGPPEKRTPAPRPDGNRGLNKKKFCYLSLHIGPDKYPAKKISTPSLRAVAPIRQHMWAWYTLRSGSDLARYEEC
jgi:hypothetical protein